MNTIKSIYTIAAKEILERRSLLGVSLGLGLLPFVGLQAKHFGLELGRNDVGAISMITMLVFTVIFALIVGGSLFGREFAERRMSFYFTRPIPSAAIWFGKISGGLLLSLISGALMILPVILWFGVSNETKELLNFDVISGYILIITFFLAAGILAGILFRSKSPWLALDIAMIPVAIGILALSMVYIFSPYGRNSISFLPLDSIFAGLGILMLGVSGVAVISGRADVKRVHRALSISFWSVILVSLFSFDGYWMWYFSPAPSDLTSIHDRVVAGASGKWIMLSGTVRHRSDYYQPAFLVNSNNGRYTRLGVNNGYDVQFSNNGNRAIWLTYEGKLQGGRSRLATMDLTSDTAEPKKTEITFTEENLYRMRQSNDGKYLAALTDKMVTVYDMATEKVVASTFIPVAKDKGFYQQCAFISADVLRVYTPQLNNNVYSIDIYDLDIKNNKAEKVGSMTGHEQGYLVVSSSGDRVIWESTYNQFYVSLYDGKTGALLNHLSKEDSTLSQYGKFLNDGRIVMVSSGKGKTGMKIFNHDGVEERTIDFGDGTALALSCEVAPGKLLVTKNKDTYGNGINVEKENYVVDINDGTTAKKYDGFMPAGYFYGWFTSAESLSMIDANTLLMVNRKDHTLNRVNVESGAAQQIEALKLHK